LNVSPPIVQLDRDRRLAELGQDLVHAAYLRGKFVLRSGRTSNYYFDKYLFETKPSILRRIASFLAEMTPGNVDRIAGPELGAVPLVTAISLELGTPFVIVKKGQKGYATGKRIEGEIYPGERVLLVEDVLTTGGAAIESAEALRDQGVTVADVLCVVDREEGAAQNLEADGLLLHPLFRRRDLQL
jgi:orotate phosphoribosyltransferase